MNKSPNDPEFQLGKASAAVQRAGGDRAVLGRRESLRRAEHGNRERTWPDYAAGGITALSRAVHAFLDGSAQEPPLDVIEWDGAEKVVLLVLDGLGWTQLNYAFEAGAAPTLRDLAGEGGLLKLTTTLPSTTATALVSLHTGLSPIEHGYVGTRLFLEEVGIIADMLTLTVLGSETSVLSLGLARDDLVSGETLLSAARKQDLGAYALTREEFRKGGFTQILYQGGEIEGYRSVADLLGTLTRICRQGGRGLVCAYWGSVDQACHLQGSRSGAFLATLTRFDSHLRKEFVDRANGRVLLLVTADHGHVDCPPERTVELTEHPDLLATLAMPPTGDARLPYLYAKEGRLEALLDYLDHHLEDVADWILAEEALNAGLFGPYTTSKRKGRLGDVILLPRENYCFTHAGLPGPQEFIGRHGGPSSQEMVVPLLWASV